MLPECLANQDAWRCEWTDISLCVAFMFVVKGVHMLLTNVDAAGQLMLKDKHWKMEEKDRDTGVEIKGRN